MCKAVGTKATDSKFRVALTKLHLGSNGDEDILTVVTSIPRLAFYRCSVYILEKKAYKIRQHISSQAH